MEQEEQATKLQPSVTELPLNTEAIKAKRILEIEKSRRLSYSLSAEYHREVLSGKAYAELTSEKPLPVSYEEAQRLFWNIFSTRLIAQGMECARLDDFNKEIMRQLLAYFLGLEGVIETSKGDFVASIPLSKGIWLCGTESVGKATLMESFSILMHVLKWRNRAFVITKKEEIGKAIENVKNAHGFDKRLRPFFGKQRCFVNLDLEQLPFFGKQIDLTTRIIDERTERFLGSGLRTYVTSSVDLDSVTLDYEGPYQERFAPKTRA